MEITNCMQMDPNILLGIANDKLRHECKSLHHLSSRMNVEQQQLENKLAEIGFHYEADLNQFMPNIK